MCGRLDLHHPQEELLNLFKLNELDKFPARYNIPPTQPVLSIINQGRGNEAHLMRWGLVPHWVKDPREFTVLANARVETVAEKPAFKSSLKNQRCLVPASGYYEWLRKDGEKQPFHIHKEDGSLLALAGLYATWEGPNGEEIDSFAILTQEATGELADIHHRTPVHVPKEDMEDWLDTKNVNAQSALKLVRPLIKQGVTSFPVSKAVNNARNEGAELIKEVSFEEKSKEKAVPKSKKSTQLDLF
ncbi:SOS response-associated peptidase [Maritalea myrionectae]|uniref:SOS response-associated peptidase n=1 Tax=Maritalea myrionectae TaxID=454601 RepID=UPI00041776E7|nr:SOS response-associated peptidase [Maritalea myrionectae]